MKYSKYSPNKVKKAVKKAAAHSSRESLLDAFVVAESGYIGSNFFSAGDIVGVFCGNDFNSTSYEVVIGKV